MPQSQRDSHILLLGFLWHLVNDTYFDCLNKSRMGIVPAISVTIVSWATGGTMVICTLVAHFAIEENILIQQFGPLVTHHFYDGIQLIWL